MTKYEKLIASCINPYYTEPGEKKLTRKEVTAIKRKAWGHYWKDTDFNEFVAFSKSGRRQYFEYCHDAKRDEVNCYN